MAIRKGNKHQLGLFFLLEACQRNAAGWSTAVWPANVKLPLPHRRSSTLLLNRALKCQAPRLYLHFEVRALDATGSERVDALGLRAVEVWSLAISAWYQWRHRRLSLSLSLSLPLTKVTDAQYRKRFRASYNIGSASKSVSFTPHIVLICALQFADFLRLCLSPRTTSRTISFLFPIVFSINLIPFFRYLLSTCCSFTRVVGVCAALLGSLRGRNSCCLWFWQLVFGVSLRDATSNLPSSPNPLSNRSVLHQWRSWWGCSCSVWRRKGVRGLCPRENFSFSSPK